MRCLRAHRTIIHCLLIALMASWQIGQPLQAATVYWDVNSTAAGAGGAVPSGTWDGSNTFWNTTSDGTAATSAWTSGDTAVFAAGTDATGSYTVTVTGTQNIGGLRFEEGNVSLSGGTLQLGSDSVFAVAAGLTATITSALGGSFALTKTGAGTLDFQGDSTATLLGALNVSGGTLRLSENGALGGVSGATLSNRATLTLDNTATNLGNRLSGGTFTSNGGILNFTHGAAAATNYSETIGAVALNAGGLTINTSQAAASQTSNLTIPTLARNVGATAFFSGTGLGTDARNSITLSTAPALVNNVVAYAVVSNGTLVSFANYVTSGGSNQTLRPLALASHDQTNQGTGWVATDNLRPTTDQTLSGNRAGYTLTLDSGIDFLGPSADRSLTLGSGGIGAVLQTGGTSILTANGNSEYILAFGANEAVFHILGELIIQRGGSTAPTGGNISGSAGLTKTGAGQLTVTNSAMTGAFRLNEGTYRSTAAAGLGAAAATLEFNGGSLALAANSAFTTTNAGGVAVNADVLITIDRAAAGAGVTHVLAGALTIGNQTLTVAKGPLVNADSAYGLTFSNTATGVTLTGSPTFVVNNNGTGAGTLSLAAVNSSGGAHTIIKQGTGNLMMSGTTGFQNSIHVQEGQVGWSNNTAATNMTESNVIFGAGGVLKSGASTVNLMGTNTYTGATTLSAGALQAQDGAGLSSSSNLMLNGGVFQSSGTFSRSLGSGAGQVQWLAGGNGGFAAQGGALTVTLAGAPAPLVWDSTANFVSGAGQLLFGSGTADNVVTFTHNIDLNSTGAALSRTVSVTDNTGSTADRAELGGVLSNSGAAGGLTKAGNGVLRLDGLNTFTGGITVSTGTLEFSTVSNNGGAASNLGQGTDGITLSGGTLAFVGNVSQATNRAIALPSSSTLDASGTGGASITYNGLITGGSAHLTLTGTGMGILNGAVTQTGTSADLIKSGTGTWRLDVAQPGLIDDVIVNAGTLILNAADAHDGDDLHIRSGTLQLNVNGALTNTMDDLNVSAETSGGGVLDVNGTTGSAPNDIILGTETLSGSIIDSLGTGSIGATATMVFRNGVVSANLTGAAALTKNGFTTVTLSGNNAGFTGTTTLVNGMLNLDYTTNNGEKLSDSVALVSSGGGHLTINGNASGTTLETVGSFTLNAGALHINVNNGAGQTATLNLGGITRATGGTVEFNLSSGSAIVQTSTLNGANSILGGYATVNGSQFATVSGGVIQGLNSTVSDNLSAWQVQGDLTDSTGYTGTVSEIVINSLRFNAAGATSTVTVASGSRLTIGSGGILVTSNVGVGAASITGGVLAGGGNDLTVHQNNLTSSFNIGSSITGSNTLTKSGGGTLLLSGTNTYTGQTTINEGTVRLSGGNAIGDGSFVSIKNDTGAVLDLNNGSETIAGLVSFGGLSTTGYTSGIVAIGSGMLTLNLTTARSYQGEISGNGTLVKTGASEQIFYGANAGFTGTVIISQGLLNLSESATVLNGATAFILNGSGELLGDQDVADIDHIGNAATITLNNTGANRGLWIRNPDLDSSEAETVGAIILGAGHNVIQADSNAGNAEIITLTAASLARNNHSTLLVRGQGLGGTAGPRGQIIFTAAPGGAVGGGGAAATTTMSIIPYLIGESVITTDATLADNFGNSFVFNTGTTNGLRPLVTTVGSGEEYIHNEAGYNALTGAALNNVRFVANPTATLTGVATQINSLVLDSSSAALAVSGPASALNIKSGAILATTTTAANGISLGGFSSLTTDAGNDFIVYVTNAANTFTLNSALTSATPLVKSGAGTLALTNTGNAFTDVYLNQGFVQVDNMDKMGAGELKFMGGGIKLAPGFTGDLFAKTWDISTGGGSLDVGLFSGGFTLTGGIVDSTPNSSDVFSFFTRATGSTGDDGLLILQGSNVFTGTTIFRNSGIASGVVNGVVLNGNTNAAINGNVEIGNITNINNGFDVVVALGANEQIVDTASITFRGASGENAYFKLMGFTETVAGINDTTREGVIENVENTEPGVATDGKLIVNSSSDFSYNAYMRNRGTGTNATLLSFEKQGSGTQMLIGDRITYSGATTISGGTLHLQGVTAWNSNIVNNSVLILDETAIRTHARDITGTGSLIKTGGAALTFAGGLNLTYQGSTTVSGGIMTVGSTLNGSTSLNVINSGSTLALTGGIGNASSITNLVVENGAALSLLDGAGNKLTGLTNLQLGSLGGTMTTLNLNVGDGATAGDNLNTDLLALGAGGTLSLFAGNQITLNLTDAGLNPNETYDLITDADGDLLDVLTGSDWVLGSTPGGFTSITLNKTGGVISITTGTLITGALYWRGLTNTMWNGDVNNWSTDKAGTLPATSIPGQGTDVIFQWDAPSNAAVTTTLEQNFKINSLTFEASTTPANTPVAVTINPGVLITSRLEIAPQVATDGIEITTGGPAAVTIGTALRLGNHQTWDVTAASILTISGSLQGEADVTKNGAGKVVLSTIADPTFNTGLTTDFTINAGILEITNAGALGTTASSNAANVVINTGGVFYLNNATVGTVATNLLLGGGTLSGGGANHTYSGTVNITGNSFINMADSNGPGSNTARNITLSGIVSGSGGLTVSSNTTTLTGGNPEGGTLLISNASSTWSGPLTLTSGTVDIGVAASPTVIPSSVTFDTFGRLIVRGVNGQAINQAGAMTFTAGTIGEYLLDNTSAVLADDFVVNQNGQVNIGSGGTGASARFTVNDAATRLNINGGVVLGGNSSISVDGGDADSFVTIAGVISDGGSGYSFAINDDAGGWGVTNDIIRLTGLNTFTGNVTMGEGVLEFNTVSNISGGASALGGGTSITSTANATLRFIGTTAQSTDRTISSTAGVLTLSANGDEAADTITFNGTITIGPTASGSQVVLSGAAGRVGIIAGGIIQSGDAADATVNGGTWTHQTGTSRIADALTVTGNDTILNLNSGLFQVRNDFTVTANAVLNLNGVGVLSYNTATLSADATLRATNGGTINLGATNAVVVTQFDELRIGVDAGGAAGVLNMGAFNQSVTEFILGNRALDREGTVNGTGTLTVSALLDLYEGTINANLASTGSTALQKFGLETVTLSGDNSGLASTGSTIVDEGTLVLDYTTNNTTKVRAASALDMRGANLVLNGNATAATVQNVGSFTLASGGNNVITLNPGGGQEIVLNLNAITREMNSQDGTVRFNLPSGTQSATNGITTDTLNTHGAGANAILGGWATVNDGTGVFFARNVTNAADGNIGAAATTLQNDVALWLTGENISDSTSFTGTMDRFHINSLRFNAAAGSDLVLSATGVLGIQSGGILVTSNVGGTPTISNGTLFSGALASNVPEIIIIQDSASLFEISSDVRTNTALTKSGAGTLLLSGNNVYSGATDIQNGTLQIGGGNAIGDTSQVILSTNRDTTLELLADETIGSLAGGMRADGADIGIVAVGSHALIINETAASTFDGKFTGSGTVTKVGNSTLTLRGNDSAGLFTGNFRIGQGLVVLSSTGTPFQGVSGITLTGSTSSLRLDNDQTTAVASRINDDATITLNSTAGVAANSLGLYMRRTAGTTGGTETLSQLVLNSGHNTIAADGTGTDRIGRILFSNATPLVRNHFSTLFVVARNFAAATGQRGRISFSVDPGGSIGGGGAAGTTTINIFPYMVGESSAAAPDGSLHFGNTFVSYESGTTDLRPLNLTTEYVVDEAAYNALGAGVLTHNIRFTTTPGAVLASDTTGINALVLDSATGVTLTGPSQGIQITSGAILSAGAGANAITGFTTLAAGAGNPYYIYVTNPLGTLTLATTALSSAAALVKSGAGTLVLGATNSVSSVYLNQGILEIADLDNIGGGTGALVFAGGTLRLGTGFVDDVSTRTISFLQAGGTIDTNGINLTLANSLGSGSGGFTKAGAGTLTLNSAATFNGSTTIIGGTLAIGATNATGGGDLVISGGGVLDVVSSALSISLLTTSGAGPVINGANAITAATGFFFNHTGDTTINAILAGGGGLLKAQANTVTLTALNTYTGPTEIHNGVLSIGSIGNVGSGASALGNPGNVADGIIRLGFATTAGTLSYTGSGHSTDRIISLQGTSGGGVLDADGTGALVLTGGVRMENAGDKTLALRGDSAPAIINTIGGIQELGGVLTLNKSDANTWMVNGGNTYTGVTQIDNGTLMIGVSNALPTGTTVRLGSGATAGTLDLNGFNQTIGSLTVETNSNSVTNQIIVDSGNTLTVAGAVILGVNANDSTTLFSATGGGSFVNNNDGGIFQVGGATGSANENAATVDFSGLTNLTVNLGTTGIFRVGDNSSNTTAGRSSVLTLATNNTITAGTLHVASNQTNSLQTLHLGAGANILNVNILNVSGSTRGIGLLDFATTAGTLTLRAADGVSASAMNIAASTTSTGNNLTGTVDLSGHSANLLLSTLTMADRSAGTGVPNSDTTATMTFDDGLLDVGNLILGRRTSSGTGDASATLNLGDGAVVGAPTTIIDTLNMAINTSAGGTVIADLNITGGTVTIGTGSGTAINMANAGAGRTVTSTIDLTGGTTTVTGNIIRTGGAGTENATVTLNGGTLDMNGNSIGTGSANINFAAQSGTLRNLGQLNDGGALTKTTAGLLIMEGTNAYTGATNVSEGTLQVGGSLSGSLIGAGDVTVTGAGSKLSGSGSIAGSTVIGSGAILAPGLGDTDGSNQTLNFTALTVEEGGQIQLSITSRTEQLGASDMNALVEALAGGTFSDIKALLGANLDAYKSTAPGDHDFIHITGSFSVDPDSPTALFKVVNRTGAPYTTASPAIGDVFNLMDWSGMLGFSNTGSSSLTAADFDFAGFTGEFRFDFSAFETHGILVVVPEPSRALFLMLGLLAFLFRRRRR
jgi:autotransporter-associated beta strand protein